MPCTLIFVKPSIFNYLKIKIFWTEICKNMCANISDNVIMIYGYYDESVQKKRLKNVGFCVEKEAFLHRESASFTFQ